jgi:hypothetical protein
MEGKDKEFVDFLFAPITGKQVNSSEMRKNLRLNDDEVVFNAIKLPSDTKIRGRILDGCSY